MTFNGRRNWNRVAASRGVAVERNKEREIKECAHYV
jgi:hypothetical protein